MALDSLTIAQQGIQSDPLEIAGQGLIDESTPPVGEISSIGGGTMYLAFPITGISSIYELRQRLV